MQSQNENILTILQKEKEGVGAIKHLKKILVNLQKIRGFANLYGITSTDNESDKAYREEILKLIDDLNQNFTDIDDLIGTNTLIVEIQQELKELENRIDSFNSNIFDLTLSHFEEYSKYIRDVINLIIDIEDRSYLLADEDKHQIILLDILTNTLLNLIENISKLRAIGVKIINKRIKSIHDASELQYYIEIVKNYIQSFNKNFEEYLELVQDKNQKDNLYRLYKRLTQDISYFVKLIEDELLSQEIIFIEPQYFFEQGEDVINSENIFYKEMFQVLDNYTDEKLSSISKVVLREKIGRYAIVLGITSFVIYKITTLI